MTPPQDNNKKIDLSHRDDDSRLSPSPSSALEETQGGKMLTRAEFQGLAEVPPEVEWFANIDNEHTRRAYTSDVKDFMHLVGILEPEEFRIVTRAHVIAWRKNLEGRELSPHNHQEKIIRPLFLFDYLCEANAVNINPVHGVKRPSEGANEGRHRHFLMTRHACSSMLRQTTHSRASVTGPSCLYSFTHGLRRAEIVGLKIRGHDRT